jgi:hypothetical protein
MFIQVSGGPVRLDLQNAFIGRLSSATRGGEARLQFLRSYSASLNTTDDNIIIEVRQLLFARPAHQFCDVASMHLYQTSQQK